MRIIPAVLGVTVAMMAAPSGAQSVVPCAGLITIEMISEPWEQYSRAYADGAIRLFEAYVSPSMAAGAVIGVLHPVPGDPYSQRVCTAVQYANPDPSFFSEVLIAEATATYDPVTGLTIRVPVRFPDSRQPIDAIWITVNQATGKVTAR
jgi:hypothetical protein